MTETFKPKGKPLDREKLEGKSKIDELDIQKAINQSSKILKKYLRAKS